MTHENNLNALVETSKRAKDDMVNATRYCQAFGKRLQHFFDNEQTQELLKTLETKITGKSAIMETRRGRSGGTWVHPLLAIALAEWLSSDFHMHVLETYHRYVEGDITLADDIIQRQTDPNKLAWIAERAEGVLVRLDFCDELKERGVTKFGFAQNTNAIYKGIFADTAKGLKETRNVKNPRDGMDMYELAGVKLAEMKAKKLMLKKNAYGNEQTTRCSLQAGKSIGDAMDIS